MKPDELATAPGPWFDDCRAALADLTSEKQQAVLDSIRSGQTVGQTMEALGLSVTDVCGVINANIVAAFSIRETVTPA